MDWQPIETAPKDGTAILLFNEEEQYTWVGWYEECEDARLFGWNATYLLDARDCLSPDFWMPLPSPPALLPPQSEPDADDALS
jgi:hypothetical protein